jgi:hypothetical protein
MMNKKYCSTGEAGRMLGRTNQCIRNWLAAEILTGVRLPSPTGKCARWYVERASVARQMRGWPTAPGIGPQFGSFPERAPSGLLVRTPSIGGA